METLQEKDTKKVERQSKIHAFFLDTYGKELTKKLNIILGIYLILTFSITFRLLSLKNDGIIKNNLLIFYNVMVGILVFLMIYYITKKNEILLKLKEGSIYHGSEHIYFPFDGDASAIKNNPKYEIAKNQPEIVFCVPFYVHSIAKTWKKLVSTP